MIVHKIQNTYTKEKNQIRLRKKENKVLITQRSKKTEGGSTEELNKDIDKETKILLSIQDEI